MKTISGPKCKCFRSQTGNTQVKETKVETRSRAIGGADYGERFYLIQRRKIGCSEFQPCRNKSSMLRPFSFIIFQ